MERIPQISSDAQEYTGRIIRIGMQPDASSNDSSPNFPESGAGQLPAEETGDNVSQFKMGAFNEHGTVQKHRFENVYSIEETEGGTILEATTDGEAFDLWVSLLENLPEPFVLLYDLVSSGSERPPSAYVHEDLMATEDLKALLKDHAEFLRQDGRHRLAIHSTPAATTLLVDEHDVIKVFPSHPRVRKALDDLGYRQSLIEIPFPHSHGQDPRFDAEEDRWLSSHPWVELDGEELDQMLGGS